MVSGSVRQADTEYLMNFIRHRKPSPSCPLPSKIYKDKRRSAGTTTRRLTLAWFDEFPFSGFSLHCQGIFCWPCVLLPVEPEAPGATRAETLIRNPLTDWKNGKEHLQYHAGLHYHLSEAKMTEFLRLYENPSGRVDQILSCESQRTVARNRHVIISVLKVLEICGREGIALRGHRDDSTSHAKSKGKFHALLRFRMETDHLLASHLDKCPRNASMISKTVQNDLLLHMRDFIIQHFAKAIADSPFLSVLADEISDVSNKEQLGIAVRYLQGSRVAEKLLAFVQVEDMSGATICKTVIETLTKLGDNLKKCRAQGYDGAGNISGRLKGCQALFQKEYPHAHYYHCASHQLNLCVSKSCSITAMHSMMDTLKCDGLFFKFSPKRQVQLEKFIAVENAKRKETAATGTALRTISKSRIKTLCETSWVERYTTLEDFYVLYEVILDCFDIICCATDKRWDTKSSTDAAGLHRSISSGDFLAAFYTNRYVSSFLVDLSRMLQGELQNKLTAYSEIEIVKEHLADARTNAEETFRNIFALKTD